MLLDIALKFAEKGWYVFPTRERPSEPFLVTNKDGTQETKILRVKSPYYTGGFLNATLNKGQIIKWWVDHPEAGIGIACEPSNLIVIDIDTKEGRKGFDNWMKLAVSDEGAFQSSTPSAGMHIIYKGLTESYAKIKTGVDVRSMGAYFIVPPSYIYSDDGKKKYYVALNNWEGEPANVPANLVDKLNLLNERHTNEHKNPNLKITSSRTELVLSARRALQKLPQWRCEEYFAWVNVGMALYSLGNDGFTLWNEWSKQSDKYDESEMEYKWNRMRPKDITLGSLFFWAYGNKQESSNG